MTELTEQESSINTIIEEAGKLQQPTKPDIKNITGAGSTQDEQLATLLSAVNVLIDRANVPEPKSIITSVTKRLITGGIFSVGIIVAIGWACASISAADALIIISSIITGGFALLRL